MISLLITLGAVAEANARFGPDVEYELAAPVTGGTEPADTSNSKAWLLPKLRFDDSQDCLTFLERNVEGVGTLRISQSCAESSEQPAPWRSL